MFNCLEWWFRIIRRWQWQFYWWFSWWWRYCSVQGSSKGKNFWMGLCQINERYTGYSPPRYPMYKVFSVYFSNKVRLCSTFSKKYHGWNWLNLVWWWTNIAKSKNHCQKLFKVRFWLKVFPVKKFCPRCTFKENTLCTSRFRSVRINTSQDIN